MSRQTIFHPQIADLLNKHAEGQIFRIDDTTVGISGGMLARNILACRPKHDFELTVFKPVSTSLVSAELSSKVMRALAHDIKYKITPNTDHRITDFTGSWPKVGFRYIQSLFYASDPWYFRLLARNPFSRVSNAILLIERCIAQFSTVNLDGQDGHASALAAMVREASSDDERRHAVALYRRTSTALCSSVASLLTNALWLAFPLHAEIPIKYVLLETLRLMPPAWTLFRKATQQYCALNPEIRKTDDLLVYPLLAHRNRDEWDQPETFLPERWGGVEDPDKLDGYLPFGHADDRCWARNLILQLAEYSLQELFRHGLVPDPRQVETTVPISPFLTASAVKIVRLSHR
jgi:hypothetical protein